MVELLNDLTVLPIVYSLSVVKRTALLLEFLQQNNFVIARLEIEPLPSFPHGNYFLRQFKNKIS